LIGAGSDDFIRRHFIHSPLLKVPAMFRFCSVLLCLIVCLAGCSSESPVPAVTSSMPDDEPKLIDVELALNWFPEAEHGGWYAAQAHGYFREAGLNVTITPGGPGASNVVLTKLAAGSLKFGITNADQLLTARANDAPVTAVFAAIQTSPRCLMVHEKSGIKSFADVKNLTLGINENLAFAAVLKKRVPLTGCRIVPYPGNVTQFLLNEDFAQQAYVFSEPFDAKKQGGDPLNLMGSEIGYNPYTSLLITSEKAIAEDADLVRRMVEASRRGWEKYLAEPAEANRLIQQANPEMGLDVLEFGVEALRPLCVTPGGAAFGTMTAERWKELTDLLVECGELEVAKLRPGEVFSNAFLPPTTGIAAP